MVRVPGTEDARRIAQTIPASWNGVIRLARGALVVVVCLLSTATLAAQEDPITALIRRQTDISSDAGQRGDLATMRSYLDDQLLFVNEDGVVFDRHDFARGAPAAAPKGALSTVTITDWVLHSADNIAVTSFVNDQVTHYNEETLNEKYLSVETWIKRGPKWKLLASETTLLHQDPPALTFPADTWNDYLGTYSAGPGSVVTITRDGNLLGVNVNGTKAPSLAAEVRDIFFTPNQPPGYERLRFVFQRDAGGRVTSTRLYRMSSSPLVRRGFV
jgi:hypothetical protein